MNILHFFRIPLFSLLLAGPSLLFAAPTTDKTADAQPSFQVVVDVPPTWQPFLDDDIARELASRLETTFRRQGYTGGTAFASNVADIKSDQPLLTLSLMEWRIGRTGNAECTFSASLKIGDKTHNLGLFSRTELTWASARNRWQLAQALEGAAESALKDLYRTIARDSLLPGIPALK